MFAIITKKRDELLALASQTLLVWDKAVFLLYARTWYRYVREFTFLRLPKKSKSARWDVVKIYAHIFTVLVPASALGSAVLFLTKKRPSVIHIAGSLVATALTYLFIIIVVPAWRLACGTIR